MRVYLTGFMGAGKTTVGRLLAGRVECSFVDLDGAIEARAGLTVEAIFERDGEARFRAFEREELRNTAEVPQIVVATGGGTPVDRENRQWMREHGVIVWLDTAYEQIVARLGEGLGRPLWRNDGEARRLFDQRLECYRDCDVSIDGGAGSARDVAAAVAAALSRPGLR